MTTAEAGKRTTQAGSARAWEGSRRDLEQALKPENIAVGTLIGDAIDALAGYIRCARCGGTPVPVEFGNLAGRPLWEWITEAERAVRVQKCKDHKPVLVGAESALEGPARHLGTRNREDAREIARRREEAARQLREDIPGLVPASELPPAGSAVFQTAGGSRVVAAETPGPKRSRTRTTAAHAVNCKCGICKPVKEKQR